MAYLLAFIAGALCTPLLPRSHLAAPTTLVLAATAILLSCIILTRVWRRRAPFVRVLPVAGVVLLGAAVASSNVNRLVEGQLDEAWHGQDVVLQGRVVELVNGSGQFSRFHFYVEQAEPELLARNLQGRQVRLSWYYGDAIDVDEHWKFTARLKRPRGFVNPRGFDYTAWLLSQELMATGYVKSGERLSAGSTTWSLSQWRIALAQRLFGDESYSAPFFRALLLGDKSAIEADQWRVLQRTGTIHLMAISGLHVGLVAGLGFLLGWAIVRGVAIGRRGRSAAWLCRLLPPLVSCALAMTYSALAGFSIPTQRAMTVVALANVTLIMGARVGPLRLLAYACLLVLLGSPLASTQNGFWLSFGAVLVLVTGFGGRPATARPAVALLQAQWFLAVGLLAPLLALGQTLSLVGPVANLIAVPVVSLVIVPGLLLAAAVALVSPLVAGWLMGTLDVVFKLLWQYLALLSDAGFAQWWPAFPTSAGLVILICLGSFMLLLPKGLYVRGLGGLIIGVALFAPRDPPPALAVTLLEVGQGLAVWVQTPGYNLLYDTGPAFSGDFDAGSRIVVPFLQTQGIRFLDTLVVSHGDNDHSGGLDGILRNMSSHQLLLGDAGMMDSYPQGRPCQQGDYWRRGEVEFRVLWPAAAASNAGSSNNRSCVLLIEWRGQRILLPGDIDAAIERRLIADGSLPNKLSVLIAAHHGSKTSSSEQLVAHTRPDMVVFSAGYQNRYGHPHPDVVERYRRAGTTMYNTAEAGAVSLFWESDQRLPRVESARLKINRAWY